MTQVIPELYTVDLAAYMQRFGEYPQPGHFLVHPDGQRAGGVMAVEALGGAQVTLLVAWKERKVKTPKRQRKTVHHVDTAKKYGCRWLVAQDTMDAVNAVYSQE